MPTINNLTTPSWLNTFGAPAAWLMGQLSLGRKLALLGLSGSLPVALLTLGSGASQSLALLGGLSALNLYLLLGHYLANRQWLAALLQGLPVIKNHREYAPLQRYLAQSTRENMRILERARAAADEVNGAAREQNDRAETSSVGAIKHSTAVSAIASAIEQMAASVRDIDAQARETHEASAQASGQASEGEQVVQQAVDKIRSVADSVQESASQIGALGQRSEQIGSIIGVIESISGQTNLLALNAAIEAARAGEQGRGFAVVADEVRTLAGRTHDAANEVTKQVQMIQSDIQGTVKCMKTVTESVEHGVTLSQQAGEALTNIRQGTTQTVERITEISDAISQQGSVSEDIARHIEDIRQMASSEGENIANVNTTSQYLLQLAERMHHVLQVESKP
ncbi:hypothetical protein MNBD_GAMMA20-2394 [hydrothermal vent metagenome]|uniref:Methyl-accepting transducer domain-containing protein n=1 Tax=hydrothermal vent metagenome TaxID=652676 RepID=A0A3B1AEI3_9ZZZZ